MGFGRPFAVSLIFKHLDRLIMYFFYEEYCLFQSMFPLSFLYYLICFWWKTSCSSNKTHFTTQLMKMKFRTNSLTFKMIINLPAKFIHFKYFTWDIHTTIIQKQNKQITKIIHNILYTYIQYLHALVWQHWTYTLIRVRRKSQNETAQRIGFFSFIN